MTEQQGFAAPTLPPADTPLPPPPASTPLVEPGDAMATPAPDAPRLGVPTLPDTPTLPASPPPAPPIAAPAPPIAAPSIPAPSIQAAPAMAAPAMPAPAMPAPAAAPPNRNENVGLPPIDPNAPRTPSPWKKKRSRARSALRFVIILALLGALGVGGYVAYQQLAAEPDASEPDAAEADAVESPDEPGTVIDDAAAVTDLINDNSEELEALDQLGVETPVQQAPAQPGAPAGEAPSGSPLDAQSYAISWRLPDAAPSQLLVDAATRDFVLTTGDTEIRHVAGTTYSFAPDRGWEIVDVPFDASTMVGLDGIVMLDDVVPTDAAPYVTSVSLDVDDYGTYVIDDVAFFAGNPTAREAWSLRWGTGDMTPPERDAPTSVVFPTVGGPGDIVIHVAGTPDGVVTRASVTAVALGGTVEFELVSWSLERQPVLPPDLG